MRGCFSPTFSFLISLFKNLWAIGVSVREGAITLTLNPGAYSAAKDLAKPSIAPFEAETLVWNGIPTFTATVLNNTTLEFPDFFKLFITFCKDLTIDKKLIFKSSSKVLSFRLLNGLRLILPGQYTNPCNSSGIDSVFNSSVKTSYLI